jgi:hypothetical protein
MLARLISIAALGLFVTSGWCADVRDAGTDTPLLLAAAPSKKDMPDVPPPPQTLTKEELDSLPPPESTTRRAYSTPASDTAPKTPAEALAPVKR